MDALDAMLESGGPSPAASLSKEKMKEIASKSSWQPPGAKADKKAAKPSAGWTKAELNALKRAVKDVDGALDKNERWKRVAERVDGRGKKECYDKYKELKAAKAAAKRTAALPEDSTFEDRLAALGIEERPAPRDAPPRGSTWTPGGAADPPAAGEPAAGEPAAADAPAAAEPRRAAPKPKSTWTPGDAGGGGAAAGLDPLVPVGRRRFYEDEVVVDDGGDDAPKPKPKPKPKKKAGGAWGDAPPPRADEPRTDEPRTDAPPAPGGGFRSRPPAQSGQTRCTNADDLVMEDFGEDF